MVATKKEIERWLQELYDNDHYSHMMVVCDTFDWDDYPVYVKDCENIKVKESEYRGKSMQQVMEVYSKNHTKEEQMDERRAFHYD